MKKIKIAPEHSPVGGARSEIPTPLPEVSDPPAQVFLSQNIAPADRSLVITPSVPLSTIERDTAINCRAGGVDPKIVEQYAAALKEGAAFPPVIIFQDEEGKRWLADGWHRCAAYELDGKSEIPADVRIGTRRDALLYAVGANSGATRTNADKRKAVAVLLDDPEWQCWTHGVIAAKAGVSQPFVSGLVRKREAKTVMDRGARKVGADGKTYDPKANKPKKRGRKKSPVTLVRQAIKELNAWPDDQPIDPLIDAVKQWLASVEPQQIPAGVGPDTHDAMSAKENNNDTQLRNIG